MPTDIATLLALLEDADAEAKAPPSGNYRPARGAMLWAAVENFRPLLAELQAARDELARLRDAATGLLAAVSGNTMNLIAYAEPIAVLMNELRGAE